MLPQTCRMMLEDVKDAKYRTNKPNFGPQMDEIQFGPNSLCED